MRWSGREMESGWDPSKIDAKVDSVLVPEAHARDADDMPMIWCSGAQPMKKKKSGAGLSYLSGIRGPSIPTGG